MKAVLIDTDVIHDFLFDRAPFSEPAEKILTFCERGQLRGFVTPVIISNVYYLLRKTAGHQKVVLHLNRLMSILDIALVDKKVILDALQSDFKDFEDALQNFAAEATPEITVIITRNTRDYKSANLSVMTPENFVKSFL